ncbi:unnamed protein product [Oncorhynchus mykiss]|uniref:PARP catalytic domain-containing protein n=2 Tax=Oncorhynchus TaxID=8016 RepID=A0A060WX63_ONCMY|nr:unnamed protein product [Oncorhynchus mykiss]
MFVCQVLVGDYTRGNSALRRPPPKGAFYRPLSTTTSTTRSPPESLYSVPTAQRRDSKEKNKCLLQ